MEYTILDTLIVSDLTESVRCIDFLIGKFEACSTRNALKKAFKRNEIMINGKIAGTGDWLHSCDIVELLETRGYKPKEFNIEIPIVYEDEYLIVVNKLSGILTSGNHFDTLVNAMVGKGILSSDPDAWDWFRPVHRLDRATSGLVILSKTAKVHRELVKLFEERRIEKVYVAIVKGEMESQGTIDHTIEGKVAQTEFKLLSQTRSVKSGTLSMIELKPKTGRTHQLRIHCSAIGHPILGDKLYDDPKRTISHKGLFLAAVRLKFIHPVTHNMLEVNISSPDKFRTLMEREERWFERVNK